MSLLEKAQELVGKAKHAAGRFTGDRDQAKPDRSDRTRRSGKDRITEAARDAKNRYRGH